ncbi:glycosyltransferase [Panacibacter sp. DH6]|uniref:Glycosyltransferase n=1 Tax=Panacibacter microcysteis TaxID=2793269 RepID=A0A931E643_9BACT|nr:glycosyltransferase [Panacibacter microcysteis]
MVVYGEKEPDEKEALHLIRNETGITFKKVKALKKSINVLADIAAYRQLSAIIKQQQCAVVHTHGSKSGLLGRLAAYSNSVPCIIHTFHGHVFHSYYNRFVSSCIIRFERLMARITTSIIAISAEQHNELLNIYKIAGKAKIKTIPVGINNNPEMHSDEKAVMLLASLPDNTTKIGFIGRLAPIKNPDFFTAVISAFTSASKWPATFFIIGDGEEKSRFQNLLTQRNISWCNASAYNPAAVVVFTSWILNITEALKKLDIVMLTSKNEGTPLSLIEAQFYGKPVISTDAGGAKDTFIHNETGFLVPQNDVETYVEKLVLLAEDTELRKRMGAKASAFAEANFSKKAEVENIRQLYHTCINNSK